VAQPDFGGKVAKAEEMQSVCQMPAETVVKREVWLQSELYFSDDHAKA
jgi:hypothetical protein